MAAAFEHLKKFSPVLRYPAAGGPQAVQDALAAVAPQSEAARELAALREFLDGKDLYTLEEEYTRTFDINPVVTLDVGFQLFGLAYKRGEFLVKMRQALARCGMEQGTELADYLPTLLELAAALPAGEDLALVEECIAPAVKRMVAGLPDKAGGFAHGLKALHAHLAANWGCSDIADPDLRDEAHDITEGYEYSPGDLDDLRLGVNRHV